VPRTRDLSAKIYSTVYVHQFTSPPSASRSGPSISVCRYLLALLSPLPQHLAALTAVTAHIGLESRFPPIPPTFDALVKESSSEYCHDVWYRYGKTIMVWLPDGEKNWRYVYSFWENSRTWQTDRQTHEQTPHDDIGRAYAYHRTAKTASHRVFAYNIPREPTKRGRQHIRRSRVNTQFRGRSRLAATIVNTSMYTCNLRSSFLIKFYTCS